MRAIVGGGCGVGGCFGCLVESWFGVCGLLILDYGILEGAASIGGV